MIFHFTTPNINVLVSSKEPSFKIRKKKVHWTKSLPDLISHQSIIADLQNAELCFSHERKEIAKDGGT